LPLTRLIACRLGLRTQDGRRRPLLGGLTLPYTDKAGVYIESSVIGFADNARNQEVAFVNH
jgi:hypothetical protein